MSGLPWTSLPSYQTARQLYPLVERIARRHRRRLPATAYRIVRVASSIGVKLALSTVPVGGRQRPARDRARALVRAKFVLRSLRFIGHMHPEPDADLAAAIELSERVVALIESGR